MSNCFRDGKYIVVPYPNAQFPNRCVKTNREVDAADYKLVFSLPPHMQKGYRDSHIQLIEAAKVVQMKRITVQVGLCKELQRSRERLQVFALICCVLGLTLGLGSAFSMGPTSGLPSKIVGLTGLVFLVCGVLAYVYHSYSFLTLCVFDGERLRISGASRKFLESLPTQVRR